MPEPLQKVSGFITREVKDDLHLLLIQHPAAGTQIPAGTVEPGELVQAAILREINEETGLKGLRLRKCLGEREEVPPDGFQFVVEQTKVYSQPDRSSFDWAHLRRGLTVKVEREAEEFTQVSYIEYDRLENPRYVTYQITGWVPCSTLQALQRRFFFWFECREKTEDRWQVYADRHQFKLFWAPLNDLPQIVSPQDEWMPYFQMR